MAAYFVFGTLVVVFALGLAAVGLTRAGFPPTIGAGRRLMAAAGVLVIATFVALVVTTKREHPREEAKAEAAEKAKAKPEQEAGAPAARKRAGGGGTLSVSEKEYSVDLAGGKALKAGKYTIDVANKGKIQHDIAVEGDGIKPTKTPLIDAGKNASLKVDLRPGKYKLYCTVPGHEQLGMKTEVTVR